MLLAGIVVTIAFIMTSLTLAQVSSLERQAATDRPVALAEEWRFLHERLANNFQVAVTAEATNLSVNQTTVHTVAATFRNIETEKGFDVVIRLASGDFPSNKTEADLVTGGMYDAWDAQGTRHYDWAYDGVNDGLLWVEPCADATRAPLGCIGGVLAYVRLSDGVSTMEEIILVSVNT